MCGLTGYHTKKSIVLSQEQKEQRKRILTALIIAMQERGTDSAGIATLNGEEVGVCKKAVAAIKLVKLSRYNKILSIEHNTVIGHTRFATVGAVNDKNAHPFHRGKIVGAHNGSVDNHIEIDKKANVDSEVIFSELNKTNNDYAGVFPRLSGQFAITWSDTSDPDSLYFVRHNNPLSIVYSKQLKTYFWASTKAELFLATVASLGIKGIETWEPKENTVYRIAGNLSVSKYKVKFKKEYYPNYSKHKWDPKKGQFSYPDEEGYAIGAEEYDPEGYTLPESMLFSLQNDPCEKCNMPINERPCYFNILDLYPVCGVCGIEEGIANSKDYEWITMDRVQGEIEEEEYYRQEADRYNGE